ncbi:hypothetical protein ODJ79_46050, partial [Actinoplanes sp. KI2]|uniref:hypothetical protein n=1 Tax=Actinoplanes sp. KI2 TaxID=2983315 RepID=UPI003983BF66|nr:hypothetical protein [Actinoplanes sp. KI2]
PRIGRALSTTMAGVAVSGLLAATPALAAESTISVAPATVGPGHTVVVSGSIPTTGDGSCPASEPAVLTSTAALFPPDGTGPQAARNSSGAFRVDYPVPKTTLAGTYEIGLRCGGGNLGVHTTLRVAAPASAGPSSTPPGVRIAVAPARVRAGHTVVISGTVPTTGPKACPASDTPILTSALFPPEGFGPPVARTPAGAFRIKYAVPTATPAGTYQIGLRCGGGNLGVSTTLRVLPQAQPAPSSAPAQQPPGSAPPSGQGGGGTSEDSTAAGWSGVAWLSAGLVVGAVAGVLGFAGWRRRRP